MEGERAGAAILTGTTAEAPLLAALIESSRDLILAIGLDWRITAVNRAAADAFARTYGLRPVVGANCLELLPPDRRERAERIWRRVMAGERLTLDHAVEFAPSGTVVYEITQDPIRDETGRIIGALLVARDVTDRRRAEEQARRIGAEMEERIAERTIELEAAARALVEQEAEYRALFESAAVGQVQIDPDGRFTRVNERFCEMMGYEAEELLSRSFNDITHPGDRHDLETFAALLKGERDLYHGEKRCQRKDGRIIWIELFIRLLRDPDGQPLRTIAVVYDVTDRRETEEALRRANLEKSALLAQLEALLEEAPAGFAFYDRQGRYVRVNAMLAEISGLSAEDHLGKHASEVMGANGERMEEIVARVAATGHAVENEEFATNAGPNRDQARHFLISFFPVWSDSRVLIVGSVLTEITDQKRHSERLRLLLAELDHRVKNTLAKVQSLITQTKGQARSPEELAAALEGRVRSMARAHGALIRGNWEGALLRALVADELAPYQAPGGANVIIHGPDLALRPSSALALGLALHELATNAAKYGALSTTAGRVTVRWALTPMGGIDLVWEEAGGPLVAPPTRQGFGTMLVERSLAYELGGEAKLDFRPGGLVCRVSIPADQLIHDAEPPPPDAPTPELVLRDGGIAGPVQRILIVEDSALVALDLQLTVEAEGWTAVGPVARLERALEQARKGEIDGAILDINLDGHESFPVADILRDRGVPFIFSTGYDRGTMLPERFRDVPVLQKPFAQDALRRTLMAAFS
ncbi:PAS domain S-box protein [Indioceanicola profundi]|uniref:PAS domain S-box protein n=1 Tax=Indioceanicola profundi TaxID=2220096 RepID=UPI0013C42271|nr:PAS domain S-box protein [Indioceanicola profundi]